MITLTTLDPKKGHFIVAGRYYPETHVFQKRVLRSHYMRKKSGYGIQKTTMQELFRIGCQTIIILAANCVYEVPFKEWYYRRDVEDFGHGEQYFYPAKDMGQVK